MEARRGGAARRDGREREPGEEGDEEGERDDDEGVAQPGVPGDRVEAQEDDDAPHVLARWHEDALERAELVLHLGALDAELLVLVAAYHAAEQRLELLEIRRWRRFLNCLGLFPYNP